MNRHVAALDRALAKDGELITLRRPSTTTPVTYQDVQVRAAIRGYEPQELVGGIVYGDSKVIISSSGLDTWPAPPRNNDKVVSGGRTRNVGLVIPIRVRDEVVRFELKVSG